MKRMIMMLALAAFLVAALSVSAVSAFAANTCPGNPNCVKKGPGNSENTAAADNSQSGKITQEKVPGSASPNR